MAVTGLSGLDQRLGVAVVAEGVESQRAVELLEVAGETHGRAASQAARHSGRKLTLVSPQPDVYQSVDTGCTWDPGTRDEYSPLRRQWCSFSTHVDAEEEDSRTTQQQHEQFL
jgi:hypothetical protein